MKSPFTQGIRDESIPLRFCLSVFEIFEENFNVFETFEENFNSSQHITLVVAYMTSYVMQPTHLYLSFLITHVAWLENDINNIFELSFFIPQKV